MSVISSNCSISLSGGSAFGWFLKVLLVACKPRLVSVLACNEPPSNKKRKRQVQLVLSASNKLASIFEIAGGYFEERIDKMINILDSFI